MTEAPESISVPTVWVGSDDMPVLHGGEFAVQFNEGAFHVTVGQATLPVLAGSPEEMAQQVKDIQFIPIRVIARYALTPEKYRELVTALSSTLERVEAAQAEGGDA